MLGDDYDLFVIYGSFPASPSRREDRRKLSPAVGYGRQADTAESKIVVRSFLG